MPTSCIAIKINSIIHAICSHITSILHDNSFNYYISMIRFLFINMQYLIISFMTIIINTIVASERVQIGAYPPIGESFCIITIILTNSQ
jgi:hypothetical protein